MKTVESTLAMLTDLSIVEDLRKVLREKDREFLPVEAKFREAVRDLTTRIGRNATNELVAASWNFASTGRNSRSFSRRIFRRSSTMERSVSMSRVDLIVFIVLSFLLFLWNY